MALDCKRLAEALRRGGDGPVAPLSRLQDTLVLWGALAAVAAVLLLLLVLTLPKPYPGLGLASGCLAAVFAVLLGLSRLVREAYVLKRGRLCESGRLLGFEWERDLGDPRTFAGVALWPEASWFWRLAVLTPGGGWLPMLGGGHGDRGRLSGEKGGGTLAEALGVPLVVGESLGALTGWAPGPTLLQSGQRLAGQGLPVLRDIDTTLEAALQLGGLVLALGGLLGLGIGYGMYEKSWQTWGWPALGLGGLLLLARTMLTEYLEFDPSSRTVREHRVFRGLAYSKTWCRFEDLECVALSCTRTVVRGQELFSYHVVLVRRDGSQLRVSNSIDDYAWTTSETQELARVCETRAFVGPQEMPLDVRPTGQGVEVSTGRWP